MTTQPTGPEGSDQQRRDQIDADHHNLRTTLDELRGASELPQVMTLLQRLRADLVEHFELEEGADGLEQVIGERAPNALNKLTRLFEEHGEFLDAIDGLIEKTNACLDGPVAEIEGGIRDLCAGLEAHEATETELITDSVFTDLGTSG